MKDKINFHSEVNMLNAAMEAVNITISNEPVLDTSIPVYCHHSDEIYNWICRKAKYYYNHIIQDIVERPTSEKYWENLLGLRVTKSKQLRLKDGKKKKYGENRDQMKIGKHSVVPGIRSFL